MNEEFIDLLCETIRFKKSVEKIWNSMGNIPDAKTRKMNIAMNRMDKKITQLCEKANIAIVEKEYENMEYDVGIPVDPLNLDDFEKDDKLFIGTLLEPTIKEKGTGNVIRNGKAILVAGK